MNANRVPGLGGNPDSNKPLDRQAQREAAQRVEKVGDVDPDEQARQQRFRQIMQSDADESDEDSIILPSPFDLSSAKQGSSSSDLGIDEIPNSSYSKPPGLSSASQDAMSDADLPQSDQFWQNTDLPDQPIGKPHFQEKMEKKGAPIVKKDEKTLSLLGPPGKPVSKNSDAKTTDPLRKSKSSSDEPHTGGFWMPAHEPQSSQTNALGPNDKKAPKERALSLSEELTSEKSTDPKASLKGDPTDFAPSLRRAQREETEKLTKNHNHNKKNTVQIISPTTPELPAFAQPAAIAATQAAATYLRPEAIPLFYQMIGSIVIMSTPPGVSRTEFVLNNPAFAKSKFFGATVELIKYSTAPDSYNIRLTGSNEAVEAFNQNLPGLMASFQTGHFSFRIGRIDAEYSIDRPVLRRKDSTDSDGGGESNQDKRQ